MLPRNARVRQTRQSVTFSHTRHESFLGPPSGRLCAHESAEVYDSDRTGRLHPYPPSLTHTETVIRKVRLLQAFVRSFTSIFKASLACSKPQTGLFWFFYASTVILVRSNLYAPTVQ